MNTCRTDPKTGSKPSSRAGTLAQIAVMTAVMCILGPVTIPIGIIPVSLIPLVIFLAVYILGTKKGTIALIVYLLIGLAGVPVFSGFSGGPDKLLGPTGGYILGFLPMTFLIGLVIERFREKRLVCVLFMELFTWIPYLFGTAWLSRQAGMSFSAALAVGVLPFLAVDLIKMGIAALAGPVLYHRLGQLRESSL